MRVSAQPGASSASWVAAYRRILQGRATLVRPHVQVVSPRWWRLTAALSDAAGPRNAPQSARSLETGYREPRPGPVTNSTSSRRRWAPRLGTSAAITGFLSLLVRASIGGFSLQ